MPDSMRPNNCRGLVRASLRVAGLPCSKIVSAIRQTGFVPFHGPDRAVAHRSDFRDRMVFEGTGMRLKRRTRAKRLAEEAFSGPIEPGLITFTIICRAVS